MANRYYLIDLVSPPSAPGRLERHYGRLSRATGVRELPHEIGHGRLSLDGMAAIVQGESSDAEHASILNDKAVLHGLYDPANGTADQAVRDYLAANRAAWERVP